MWSIRLGQSIRHRCRSPRTSIDGRSIDRSWVCRIHIGKVSTGHGTCLRFECLPWRSVGGMWSILLVRIRSYWFVCSKRDINRHIEPSVGSPIMFRQYSGGPLLTVANKIIRDVVRTKLDLQLHFRIPQMQQVDNLDQPIQSGSSMHATHTGRCLFAWNYAGRRNSTPFHRVGHRPLAPRKEMQHHLVVCLAQIADSAHAHKLIQLQELADFANSSRDEGEVRISLAWAWTLDIRVKVYESTAKELRHWKWK